MIKKVDIVFLFQTQETGAVFSEALLGFCIMVCYVIQHG